MNVGRLPCADFPWNCHELQRKSVRETLWPGDIRYGSRLHCQTRASRRGKPAFYEMLSAFSPPLMLVSAREF